MNFLLAVVRATPERKRMPGTAVPVLGALTGVTSWTRGEVEGLSDHLSFPLPLFGWLAPASLAAFAGLLILRASPGSFWALLYPPALGLLG